MLVNELDLKRNIYYEIEWSRFN